MRRVRVALSSLPSGEFDLVIKKAASKRSDNQNRLYRVWVRIIAGDCGYSEPEMHDALRYKFLRRTAEINHEEVVIIPSTTELTIRQMEDYMTQIEVLAIEMGITLPHPEDLALFDEYGNNY